MGKIKNFIKKRVEKFEGYSKVKKVLVVVGVIVLALFVGFVYWLFFVPIDSPTTTETKVIEERSDIAKEESKEVIKEEKKEVKEPTKVEPEAMVKPEKVEEKPVASQEDNNEFVKQAVDNIMQESFGDMLIGTQKEDNINVYMITADGLAVGTQLKDTRKEFENVKKIFKNLSKEIDKLAKAGNSNEDYQIWLMNDINTDNVLAIFTNGEVLDFTK